MSDDKKRYEKVLAVAINPGAYEGEAIAALLRARELVKRNPALAYSPLPPMPLRPKPAPPDEASFQAKVTNVSAFWLNIFLSNISQEAYGLGLKSKMVVDFHSPKPQAVDIRCDGPKEACEAFQTHFNWLLDNINSQPRHVSCGAPPPWLFVITRCWLKP
jgi:hypothetical protein